MQTPRRIALLATAISGCALAFHGTHRSLPISSNPEGVRVDVDGERVGVTPAAPRVHVGVPHRVVFRRADYPDAVVETTIRTDPLWIILDIVLTLGIGCIPDALSGAWHDIPESPILHTYEGHAPSQNHP